MRQLSNEKERLRVKIIDGLEKPSKPNSLQRPCSCVSMAMAVTVNWTACVGCCCGVQKCNSTYNLGGKQDACQAQRPMTPSIV